MVHPIDPILKEALGLSEQDRAVLVHRLIASFDAEGEIDDGADRAWAVEVARRVARMDAGAMKMVSGDQVRREARGMIDGHVDG
ncbi:addiction module protein [Phycisphaeraceae bacterium D3-23]